MTTFGHYEWSDNLLRRDDVSLGCKVVGQFLANRADNKTGRCWPSMPAIAAGVGLTVRQVRRILRSLESHGLIQDVGRHGEDPRYATRMYGLIPGGALEPPLRADTDVPPEQQSRGDILGRSGGGQVSPGTTHKRTTQKSTLRRVRGKTRTGPPIPSNQQALFKVICDIFGLKPKTKPQCSRVGKRAEEFNQLDATADDISARKRAHEKQWPLLGQASPESVLKWWDRFAPKPRSPMMPEPRKGVDE